MFEQPNQNTNANPQTEGPQGHPDFELTVEQKFFLRRLEHDLEKINLEDARKLVLQVYEQMFLKTRAFQHFIKNPLPQFKA